MKNKAKPKPKPKDKDKSTSTARPAFTTSSTAPPETQSYDRQPILQSILDNYASAFLSSPSSPSTTSSSATAPSTDAAALQENIQRVKKCLYERDFAGAFDHDDEEMHVAYAVRWSAGRALGYWDLMSSVQLFSDLLGEDGQAKMNEGNARVVCIGAGGGAEMAALAALRQDTAVTVKASVHCVLVDVADWSGVTERLTRAIDSRRTQGSTAEVGIGVEYQFVRQDVLALDTHAAMARIVHSTTRLVTIMFTLNELFSASMSRAVRFLLTLTDTLRNGAMLLVVDSPGSYSTVVLGQADARTPMQKKQYPMQWLLDHTLLESASEEVATDEPSQKRRRWKKIEGCDSRWFRRKGLDLSYPFELEDMRYQTHLFQRI